MFPLKVTVSSDLITQTTAKRDGDRSKYTVCCDCLIAQAISQAMGEPVTAGYAVWRAGVEGFLLSSNVVLGRLPQSAQVALARFDSLLEVEPFEFEISPNFIRVNVTQELIDQAVANRNGEKYDNIRDCVGATALKSILPRSNITVGVSCATIDGRDFKVSVIGMENIIAFAARKPVQPFILELNAM